MFGVIFAAELPDKTMLATLVLATRFPPRLVWVGVAGAFAVQCLIAVLAGGLLSLAPERLVAAVAAVLFAGGAAVLLLERAGDGWDPEDGDDLRVAAPPSSGRAVATSFGVLFVSEWGDLSQLATAGFAARSQDPVSVFAGAVAALWAVAALAVVSGRALVRVVPLRLVRRMAGGAMAVLAVLAAVQAMRG